MKIIIVSDTHNNWENFKKTIEWANKENIKLILHCGDISTEEIIKQSEKFFNGEIKYVRGNADVDLLDLPDFQKIEISIEKESLSRTNFKKIGFVHFPNEAKKMAQSGEYDIIFYGHTHKAWDEKIICSSTNRSYCHIINPGELAGQFYKPTFAVYNIKEEKLELKILEKLK